MPDSPKTDFFHRSDNYPQVHIQISFAMDPTTASFVPLRGRRQSNPQSVLNGGLSPRHHEVPLSNGTAEEKSSQHTRSTSANDSANPESLVKSGSHTRSRSVPGNAGASYRGRAPFQS